MRSAVAASNSLFVRMCVSSTDDHSCFAVSLTGSSSERLIQPTNGPTSISIEKNASRSNLQSFPAMASLCHRRHSSDPLPRYRFPNSSKEFGPVERLFDEVESAFVDRSEVFAE